MADWSEAGSAAAEQLRAIMPHADVAAWLKPLAGAMAARSINTPRRMAAFLAQLAHESGGLTRFEEDLRYRAATLVKQWARAFPDMATAQAYAKRGPVAIANRAYALKNGNGDEASGDGWRFRGRGPIQITGRANYRDCGRAIAFDLEADPDTLLKPLAGAHSAAWYWHSRSLNALADLGTDDAFERITRKINGGLNGLAERRAYWNTARLVLGAE